MKIKSIFLFVAGMIFLSGCFSINSTTSHVSGEHHILVQNYGWRLFYAIPLFCGNATKPQERIGPWAFFRDDVTLDKVQDRFFTYAQAFDDGEVKDLTYHYRETTLFNIPFTQFPVPIPYIICYREIQLSGVVK